LVFNIPVILDHYKERRQMKVSREEEGKKKTEKEEK
jgi:hypothetical protein